MLSRIREIFANKFVRNVAIVATGTAGAQAITMAFAPVVARLYGPEAFGLLGTFIALVSVVAPIAALAYPIAIVLPKDDSDAKGIVRLSICIALATTCVTALLLVIAGQWLVELLKVQAISSYIPLVPFFMLFSALLQIAQQWLMRKRQFIISARVAVQQALILNSAKVGIGWFYPKGAILIILATAGNALYVFMLSVGIKRSKAALGPEAQQSKTKTPLLELAKRHLDFPLYRAPQVFLNGISQSMPVLLLAGFFGPAAAGFYTLGKAVLDMPSTLIGTSVGNVFYPHIVEAAHNGENIARLIARATLALAAVGFFPFLLVFAFGPWLFGVVFGAEWVMAGEYARWLALWLYFAFLNRPSVSAIPTLSLQGFFLTYEIVSIVGRLVAIAIGFHFFESDLVAVALFSFVGIFLNASLVMITLIKSKNYLAAVLT